jgi:hypothetical protein
MTEITLLMSEAYRQYITFIVVILNLNVGIFVILVRT